MGIRRREAGAPIELPLLDLLPPAPETEDAVDAFAEMRAVLEHFEPVLTFRRVSGRTMDKYSREWLSVQAGSARMNRDFRKRFDLEEGTDPNSSDAEMEFLGRFFNECFVSLTEFEDATDAATAWEAIFDFSSSLAFMVGMHMMGAQRVSHPEA